MNNIRYIQFEELEKIARSVWYAKYPKGERVQEMKRSTFQSMGMQGMSTEFPMRSGEWKEAGSLEIMVTYPKWDIPAMIYVRKPTRKDK